MFNISTYRKHQLKQPRRFAVIRKTDIVYNKHFHLRDLNSCHCRLYYQHQYRVQPTERIKGKRQLLVEASYTYYIYWQQ